MKLRNDHKHGYTITAGMQLHNTFRFYFMGIIQAYTLEEIDGTAIYKHALDVQSFEGITEA